jgi:hypothetical protein
MDDGRTAKRLLEGKPRRWGGATYKKVDGLCWIRPEEYGHTNMENKSFGQNKMGTCQQ